MCRTWTSDGRGAYNGTWRITAQSGEAFAQARLDGPIATLFTTSGTFTHVKSFVTRGCNTGCTDWS